MAHTLVKPWMLADLSRVLEGHKRKDTNQVINGGYGGVGVSWRGRCKWVVWRRVRRPFLDEFCNKPFSDESSGGPLGTCLSRCLACVVGNVKMG